MRILVAIKRTIDYAVPVRVKADKTGVEGLLPKMSMNPFCEIALEEALRLREKSYAHEVVAVSIGPPHFMEVLRSALALGADRALHVPLPPTAELLPLGVARVLAALAAREQPGLMLLGKQAIDDDCNQTGQMVAGLLGWPQATFASRVEMLTASGSDGDAHARVTCEGDHGEEVFDLRLPAVITADLRLNTPRFVTLPAMMRAKKKPIETVTPAELGLLVPEPCVGGGMEHDSAYWASSLEPQVETLCVEEPPQRPPGRRVASVEELVARLRDEAKVL